MILADVFGACVSCTEPGSGISPELGLLIGLFSVSGILGLVLGAPSSEGGPINAAASAPPGIPQPGSGVAGAPEPLSSGVVRNPDQTIDVTNLDGSTEHIKYDSVDEYQLHGAKVVEYRYPGAVLQVYPDGATQTYYADGRSSYSIPGKIWVTIDDRGFERRHYPDGSIDAADPTGFVHSKMSPDGHWTAVKVP